MNAGTLLLMACASLGMLVQPLPPPFPREGIVKIFENRYVVAWDGQFVKDLRSPLHEHTMDLAAYFLTGGKVNTISADGLLREGEPFSAGRALFQPRGVIHIEEYKSAGTRALGLELKALAPTASAPAVDDSLDPVKAEPATYRALLDQDRVRIIETTLRPNTSRVRHAHPGRLVMEPTACTGSRPPRSAVTRDGMRAWWVDAETHVEDHIPSKTECRRIEFEIKAAR